ncbi:condensation domain-containing protein [Pedobacter sp. PLR]|uniref:condensation domain-containing protein n=1 Tax=Pedobacter sp. PLR TaxID=2994465 RepID=UPI0022466DA4|nr:condensation domain-containing protein [Pedobacter sp. PLR]MCX2453787.1 condensation domain-containing protein [Pedobacter sp. PLR]
MKRKLLFAERMLHGNGEAPFNALIPVKIKGVFPEESIHHALKKLQEKHPLLNAAVEDDEQGMPWFVVKEGLSIPVRITERLSNADWKTQTTQEWATVFDTRKGPLMRLVWIKGAEASELILVIHHCLCDGGSAMAILSEFLMLLDDGSVDIGKEDPILDVNDIIPAEVLKDRKKRVKAKLIGSVATFALWLIPVKKKLVERKKDYMIHWKLQKEWSDQLMIKCKAEQVTVNTVLCAAVLAAFKAVRKENFHNKISCPVDIRRFAPRIKRDNIFAFGLMFVVSADLELDFFSNARKMQDDINKKTAKLDAYENIMMMEESHASMDKFTNFLKYGKSGNDCMFSNLGKVNIPHQYQNFELETIFSPSVIGPLGNTTTLVTSTYRGQMDFTFIASEGFIPYEEGLAIQSKIMEIISKKIAS